MSDHCFHGQEIDRLHGHTVGEVAKLSGVSVRTLHHYDEIGLLKPAGVGLNGYRYYGEEELLRLQQILFHRELGLSLEEIGRVLDAPDFDRVAALQAHRKTLMASAARYRRLIRTIDETLAALKGESAMAEKAMYRGFDPEVRARNEAWVIGRYGRAGQYGIDMAKDVKKDWTQADFDQHQGEIIEITRAFTEAMRSGVAADAEPVQVITRRLHAWASRGWTGPITRGGFVNMAEVYSEHPGARAAYETLSHGLTDYIIQAMRVFAEAELS